MNKREKKIKAKRKDGERSARKMAERNVKEYRIVTERSGFRAYGNGGKQGVAASVSLPAAITTGEKDGGTEKTVGDVVALSEAGAGRITDFYRALTEKTVAACKDRAKSGGENLSVAAECSFAVAGKTLTVTRKTVVATYARPSLSGEPIAKTERTETDVFLLPDGVLKK